MIVEGLEINSPEYWELRHQRDFWPRTSEWATSIVSENIPKNARVVIVGCGQGYEGFYIKKKRPDVYIYAFDISKTAIEKANKTKKDFQEERIDFEVRDLFKINTPKNLFDYGISIQNLEHWKTNTHRLAFKQMFKLIKPGGKLFITGVGKTWNLNKMNYGLMIYKGKAIKTPNDYHYCNWKEQEIYDHFIRVKAKSVKFYRRRGKDRVIAEGEK